MSQGSRRLTIYAIVDGGSSVTLLQESVAQELELVGERKPLHMGWTGNVERTERNSRVVEFVVTSVETGASFRLRNVRTVDVLGMPRQSFRPSLHPHLKNVPLAEYKDKQPLLLIGLPDSFITAPLRTVSGDYGDVIAIETRLGWIAYGGGEDSLVPHVLVNVQKRCSCDEELTEAVKIFYDLEAFGVRAGQPLLSDEDQQAIKQMAETTRYDGERYTTRLLWRDERDIPDSRSMAMRRLASLSRKLSRDPPAKENMERQINEYVAKGYVRKLCPQEANARDHRTWYIPLFTVSNPNKPGKVRIVWDCAASVDGVSLNSCLLKGPDLLVPLAEVLIRFREGAVAVAADITEMFHQIRIAAEDHKSQRFLWADDDTGNICEYAMQVVTFGAVCSPFQSQFVKNANADRFADTHPAAVNSIKRNFYVDDWIESFATPAEAKQRVQEVIAINRSGGFALKGWASNVSDVVRGEASSEEQKVIDEKGGARVLGMHWAFDGDWLKFHLKDAMETTIEVTKRGVLRVLMTVFDPLGLIAHFVIEGKLVLRRIWRQNLDWDVPIIGELAEQWKTWCGRMPQTALLNIPRHYGVTVDNSELHVFVDASQDAYGCVVYLRERITATVVRCQLVMAKSRVAPLKAVTIPRLELMGAVLGVRAGKAVQSSLAGSPRRLVFWSDSTDVLYWIASTTRKFKPFVAFRISEILDNTSVADWYWVPTKENIADVVTKPRVTLDADDWFGGPKFIHGWTERMLPGVPHNTRSPTADDEFVHEVLVHGKNNHQRNWDEYTSLDELKAVIAHGKRFLSFRRSGRTGQLAGDELDAAEMVAVRWAQEESYAEEMELIQVPNRELPKSSPLYSLSVGVDPEGVLRLDGRVQNLLIPFEARNPAILPRRHALSYLLVKNMHEKMRHANAETVLNELRQRYLIIGLRTLIKQVSKQCQRCKIRKARPRPPQMGCLPDARTAIFMRPFSYCGVDYFGPMLVTVGRSNQPRWGVLFTCLTIRAVHLEIVHSLDTDSCVMAIRNFIARRGWPKEMWSDNGTCFKAAAPLFPEMIWNFNPPTASHMGGAWERLVRSVRATAEAVMRSKPSDEVLRAALMEAETIINMRPLTYVPVDPDNPEALTPNHFLLGHSSGQKGDVRGEVTGTLLRKSWLNSQRLANQFWIRWIKEYLPTITRRTKWTKRTKPIRLGDIVVIYEKGRRNSWQRGRVVEIRPDKKTNQVRSVVIKTSTGVYHRPCTKVAVLDVGQHSDEDDDSSEHESSSSEQSNAPPQSR